jgi:type III pantothenate kinase
MLLTIDAGNTNTVFALFEGETLKGQWRIATDGRRTADEYGVWLRQIMQFNQLPPESVTGAIIASVVPQTLFDLKKCCRTYFHVTPLIVGEAGVESGMEVRIDRPSEVGADRIVNAFAARRRYPVPLIVLDFGTATTFDVVNESGAYVGGVIAPGVNLSLEALHRAAAKLPKVAIEAPPKVTGTNTVSAMQSGVYYGYVGMIEGIVSRIRREHGQEMFTVATGGLASLFAGATDAIQAIDKDLTIHGLREIYEMNLKR